MSTYQKNLSLILSRVLDDVGVNEECVMIRRRLYLASENNLSVFPSLSPIFQLTAYTFGSQTEGTTTDGLRSDRDILVTDNNWNVIEDWKDWLPGKMNALMLREETSYPGYCELQVTRPDIPLPEQTSYNYHYTYDEKHRVIMTNAVFTSARYAVQGVILQGPAFKTKITGLQETDNVFAMACHTWPQGYRRWSLQERRFDWPTPEMVRFMETSGCFVVPVGHRLDQRPERKWRISTSLAERCLMFSLNITQIRCYVILKMVVKTFIEPCLPDVISSYICKTLLFHCIERTDREFWKETSLLQCVHHVLLYMLAAVYTIDCPNYFNDSANLLLGKIDHKIQTELLKIIRRLVLSKGRFLLEIKLDNFGSRVQTFITDRSLMLSLEENEYKRCLFCAESNLLLCAILLDSFMHIVVRHRRYNVSINTVLKAVIKFAHEDPLKYRVSVLLLRFLCSYLATVDMSRHILFGQSATPLSQTLYRLSLKSDATSSRLKYASYLYCAGELARALDVLQDIEMRKERAVPCCCCKIQSGSKGLRAHRIPTIFLDISKVALCVMFTESEINCCPPELRFELFRSTASERLLRDECRDNWMNLAIMDAVPYHYFLMYLVSRSVGPNQLKDRMIETLKKSILNTTSLGHKETGLNILGQCMEHEGRFEQALRYYSLSLRERPSNNAAKWHIPRLLYVLIHSRTGMGSNG